MPDKKWLKRKGCKNCALVWRTLPHYQDCDTDCEGHGEWLVQPYYPNREFIFISDKVLVNQRVPLRTLMTKNVYFKD